MVLNMTIILKIASKYGTTDRNNPKISVMMIVISSIPLCHLAIFFFGGGGRWIAVAVFVLIISVLDISLPHEIAGEACG